MLKGGLVLIWELDVNLELTLVPIATRGALRTSVFPSPPPPPSGLFSNSQEAFKQSKPFGAIKPCITIALALPSLSIA